jgi:hypothetical protein
MINFSKSSNLLAVFIVIGLLNQAAFSNVQVSRAPVTDINAEYDKECLRAKKVIDDEVQRQIRTPFEEKFSIVTSDPVAESRRNIARLRLLLNQREGFVAAYTKAGAMLPAVDSKLQIMHGANIQTAEAILKSGAVLSKDELVRKGIIPADQKSGRSKIFGDGLIGEQDVVFLGIQDFSDSQTHIFGEVSFVFKKAKLLANGYFTPFAFNMGAGHFPTDPTFTAMGCTGPDGKFISISETYGERAMAELSRQIDFFRAFVFKGSAAYRELLRLSIASYLWEKSQDFSAEKQVIDRLVAEREKLPEGERFQTRDHLGMEPVFARFGQNPDAGKGIPGWKLDTVKRFLDGRDNKWNSRTYRYLGAYQGFPHRAESSAPLLSTSYSFWELKVPRQVSLSDLEGIEVPQVSVNYMTTTTGGKTTTQETKISTDKLQQAIKDYAVRSGRQIEVKETKPGILYFRFLN